MPVAYCCLLIQWWQPHPNHFVWGRFWLWSWWNMILRTVLSAQTTAFRLQLRLKHCHGVQDHHSQGRRAECPLITSDQSPSLASSLASSPNTPQNYPYSSTGSNPIPLQCLMALILILLKSKLPSCKSEPKPSLCYVSVIAQDSTFPKG